MEGCEGLGGGPREGEAVPSGGLRGELQLMGSKRLLMLHSSLIRFVGFLTLICGKQAIT